MNDAREISEVLHALKRNLPELPLLPVTSLSEKNETTVLTNVFLCFISFNVAYALLEAFSKLSSQRGKTHRYSFTYSNSHILFLPNREV